MTGQRVVVVGGAGYIGSHVVRTLLAAGREVEIVDDLSTGRRERNPGVRHHEIDVTRQVDELAEVLAGAGSVIHLVALKDAAESASEPLGYYRTNVEGVRVVLEAMVSAGVRNLLFSSSASVYGAADGVVDEGTPTVPVSPYGRSKLAGEWLVAAATRAHGLACASLRYFNVAGAVEAGLADTTSRSLVPAAVRALRQGEALSVYGTDYATRDGSAVRDYVHVLDVAEAHVAVSAHLEAGPPGATTFNIGTGTGFTVLEMVEEIGRVAGAPLATVLAGRREGDMAVSVADTGRVAAATGWRPRHTLTDTLASAWRTLP